MDCAYKKIFSKYYLCMMIDLPTRHRFSHSISIITLRITLRLLEEGSLTMVGTLLSMLGDSLTILLTITLICKRITDYLCNEGDIKLINPKPQLPGPSFS
jgi:hypothetical protein